MPPRGFVPPNQHKEVRIRTRGYVPHWELPNAAYSITYRLEDSLPRHVVRRLTEFRLATVKTEVSPAEAALRRLEFERRLDRALDRHAGSACLRDEAAEIVAKSLQHFDGERYQLHAWCVMPNHVHVVVQPLDGRDLADILHAWKSYTANRVNEVIGRTGRLWAREYWDRVIRDEDDLWRTMNYVRANPGNAGLRNWPWAG